MQRILLCVFLILPMLISAQSKKPKKIKNINANIVKKDPRYYGGNNLFAGKVAFDHEGTKFYCDSAVHYSQQNLLVAWSNVRIKNDTISMNADSIRYTGKNKVAEAFDKVKLKDKKQTITADYMRYDRNNDIAQAKGNVKVVDKDRTTITERIVYYRQKGEIHNPTYAEIIDKDGNKIVSQSGTFNINTKENVFQGNVKIDNKDYKIDSDRAVFNQKTSWNDFYANTRITSKKNPSNYIVTNRGRFNNKTGEAYLLSRSTVYNDGREIHANNMYYKEKTGYAKAQGDVWINDPKEKRYIKGDFAESFQQEDSAYVTGNALAVKEFKDDTLYFHADTLLVVKRKDKDSTQLVRGFYNAKFYKRNLQGKGDSISYNETTGVLSFFKNPVIWSGNHQIIGDTIIAYTDPTAESVDSVRVKQQAFVISKVDSIPENKEYHQVKGRTMLALFYENELKWIEIEGNAQSLTYMDEEKENKTKDRIGINRSDCGIIEAQLSQRNVDILACKIKATSKLYPESKLPEDQRKLPDFNWREWERFTRWEDILVEQINLDELEL